MLFIKMHSCKNDFIFTKIKNIDSKKILKLSNRNSGIGFDQMFNISYIFGKNVFFNIYNNDGSLAESCGNGLKCLGSFIKNRYNFKHFIAISNKKYFSKIFIKKRLILIRINFFSFLFKKIGFFFLKRKMFINISNKNIFITYIPEKLNFFLLSIGNPHIILFTNRMISKINNIVKKFFFNGVNVSIFFKFFKTYERGSGITKCCGTATTSFGMIYILKYKKFFKTKKMIIYWKGKNVFSKNSVFLIGKSNFIFKGKINENNL
ncbi:hypothetical protein ONB79_00745 [Candidatus Vidania fulgoroideae]|nr:hypothetical protein ONB79_00745 [Candidatus Vidania fulgoroideae]WDR79278.1 hypothetical protein ONB65_00110 [Candidatus Vidania fulgoroideae]